MIMPGSLRDDNANRRFTKHPDETSGAERTA
jgi:hypothetical protein